MVIVTQKGAAHENRNGRIAVLFLGGIITLVVGLGVGYVLKKD